MRGATGGRKRRRTASNGTKINRRGNTMKFKGIKAAFQGNKKKARRASIQRKGERMVKLTIQRAAA